MEEKRKGNSIFYFEQEAGIDSVLGNWTKKRRAEAEAATEKEENNQLQGNTNSNKTTCKCNVHSPAKTFKELVLLVKDAEEIMIQNKLTDIGDRINCLRGIYYGAEWSMDYAQEQSSIRNSGFNVYTGHITASVKHDARKMLKCSDNCKGKLFEALYQSPEVFDSSTKVTDFGHLMIALDARRSYIARNTNLPYGGTGLENVTWIGDIGGGAGMLAYKRVTNPQTRAKKLVFDSEHDYGGSVNIEGDIAGYVVGMDNKKRQNIVNPTDNMEYIYKGLETFFDKDVWTTRVDCFLAMIGCNIDNGVLKNRDKVLKNMIDSVEGMAQFYIAVRALDKSYNKRDVARSFGYIKSCAEEVSEIFLDGLLDLQTHQNSSKYKAVSDPEPTKVDNKTIEEGIIVADKIISNVEKILKLL